MKLLIASDIHGDVESARALFDIFQRESCDKILLLGDLLYFGPRNAITPSYDPKEVITLLNANRENIITVRGNCDSEVDQMVLDFPILADYCFLSLDGLCVFATHGHLYNKDNPPPLRPNEILLHGHTHVLRCESFGNNNWYVNPGSMAFPKEGNTKTYMIYENKTFTIKDLEGNEVLRKEF